MIVVLNSGTSAPRQLYVLALLKYMRGNTET